MAHGFISGVSSIRTREKVRFLLLTLIAVTVGGMAFLTVEWALLTAMPEVKVLPFTARRAGGGGALLICGGGKLPDEVRVRFLELAGGRKARIVVIPTAHAAADGPNASRYLEPWVGLGAASVKLLHTRSRQTADDPSFIKPLNEATGVWLAGGKQTWLADTYVGTAVERQLKAVLRRGGVIGGSSAGAAIMTRVMIAGGRADVSEGQGFDLLPGSVVDQHFMRRNRVGRLLEILGRHPGLVGFGIDERTAMVVRGKRISVIGDSYVMACVPGSAGHAPRLEVLKHGDETELSALKGPGYAITSALGLDETLSPFSDQ